MIGLGLLAAVAAVLTPEALAHAHRELGKAEGACRAGEPGPAIFVTVTGLKDRQGLLKLEVYPANDEDFLQDDKILVREGKIFRRVEVPVPASDVPELCVRIPAAGTYAVSLLHDRDSNHKFTIVSDGVGFSGNPKLGWSKPKAAASSITASAGLTRTRIVLNYRRGLFAFGPVSNAHR